MTTKVKNSSWGAHTVFVVESNIGEFLSPGAVDIVRESRMIAVQLRSVRQNLMRKSVQVTNFPRKPRNLRKSGNEDESGGIVEF